MEFFVFCIPVIEYSSYMIRPIKHHKASKVKKSKTVKLNVAVHPFVLVAIAAALSVVVFLIVTYYFRYLK